MNISFFFRDFGLFILIGFAVAIVFIWRYSKTKSGQLTFSNLQLSFPYLGRLYRKFYLSRITGCLETSLSSGLSAVKSLEISSDIVGNDVYKKILLDSTEKIRGGSSISESLSKYKEIPSIVSSMIRIGEETGKLNFILKTLSRFYKREVDNEIDTLVSLIEPALIIVIGFCVGFLLVSIIGPIYSISSGI